MCPEHPSHWNAHQLHVNPCSVAVVVVVTPSIVSSAGTVAPGSTSQHECGTISTSRDVAAHRSP